MYTGEVMHTHDVMDTSAVLLVPEDTSTVVNMEMSDVSTSFHTSLQISPFNPL